MLEFQEKRKIRRFIYSKFTIVILIVFIAVLFNSLWEIYDKQRLAKDNLAKTAAIFESLKGRESKLNMEIERLKTDGGVEAEVREKYGLVKPGEEVIVVAGGNNGTNTDSNSNQDDGYWQSFLNWFK